MTGLVRSKLTWLVKTTLHSDKTRRQPSGHRWQRYLLRRLGGSHQRPTLPS